MTQLIELSKQLIHQWHDICTLLFNNLIEVAYITEQDRNFVLFLLKRELITLQVIFDEFWN